MRYYYTFWIAKDNDLEHAVLMDKFKPCKTKHSAFRKASNIATRHLDSTIFVRKVSMETDICTEWKFKATSR